MNQASNVTPITAAQPAPAARFQIAAQIDGFPITVEVEGKADSLRAMIDRLKAIGAEPPHAPAPTPTEPTKKTAPPVCPDHNVPLKSGRHGWFCSKRVGNGYCNQTA